MTRHRRKSSTKGSRGLIASYETAAGRRYRVRYRKPDRMQTDKRGFRTKREAEDFLASVEVSKLRGEWVDPTRSRITVAEWAKHWYDAQLQLKLTTLSGYRHSLDKHVSRNGARGGSWTLVTPMSRHGWPVDVGDVETPPSRKPHHLPFRASLKYAVREADSRETRARAFSFPEVVKKSRGGATSVMPRCASSQQVAAITATSCCSSRTPDFAGVKWLRSRSAGWTCFVAGLRWLRPSRRCGANSCGARQRATAVARYRS